MVKSITLNESNLTKNVVEFQQKLIKNDKSSRNSLANFQKTYAIELEEINKKDSHSDFGEYSELDNVDLVNIQDESMLELDKEHPKKNGSKAVQIVQKYQLEEHYYNISKEIEKKVEAEGHYNNTSKEVEKTLETKEYDNNTSKEIEKKSETKEYDNNKSKEIEKKSETDRSNRNEYVQNVDSRSKKRDKENVNKEISKQSYTHSKKSDKSIDKLSVNINIETDKLSMKSNKSSMKRDKSSVKNDNYTNKSLAKSDIDSDKLSMNRVKTIDKSLIRNNVDTDKLSIGNDIETDKLSISSDVDTDNLSSKSHKPPIVNRGPFKYAPKEAANKIQSYYRMYLQQNKYMLMRDRSRKYEVLKKKFLRVKEIKSDKNGSENEESTVLYHITVCLFIKQQLLYFYGVDIENKYKHDAYVSIDHLPLLSYERISHPVNKKMIIDYLENLLINMYIQDYELKFQQGI